VFLVIGGVVVFLLALMFVKLGAINVESRFGAPRDGIRPGRPALPWSLPDTSGVVYRVPAGRWQLLLFATHALQHFPGVAVAMNQLLRDDPGLEIVVLSAAPPELVRATLDDLELRQVPLIPVDLGFYARHYVNKMPFAIVVDKAGVVRGNGLANHADVLIHMVSLARRGAVELGPSRPTQALQ
jgi:hypothetical protein